MEGFCFVITDKSHNVYYASEKLRDVYPNDMQGKDCFAYASAPTPSLFRQLVEHDIKSEGFFNGYIKLGPIPEFWFCDYGKRFDNNGEHTGYEALLYSVSNELSDYMTHFYQNLEQRVKEKPSLTLLDAYLEEKSLVSKHMKSDFPEFMIALQDEYEK